MVNPNPMAAKFREAVLNLDKVGTAYRLPQGLQHVEPVIMEHLPGELVASLTAYVLSEHLAQDTETATEQVPADWWSHAKDSLQAWAEQRQWTPRPIYWWLRHVKPAEFRTLTLSVTWHRAATRPHSTLQVESLGPVVYQERTERAWDRD